MNVRALAFVTLADASGIRYTLWKKYEPEGIYLESENYNAYKVFRFYRRAGTLWYRNIQMDYMFSKKEQENGNHKTC